MFGNLSRVLQIEFFFLDDNQLQDIFLIFLNNFYELEELVENVLFVNEFGLKNNGNYVQMMKILFLFMKYVNVNGKIIV